MSAAKKTKLDNNSFQPACKNSSDDDDDNDDDDLFVSVWDGNSSKKTTPKTKTLLNTSHTSSEPRTKTQFTGTSHKNGLNTITNDVHKPSFSGFNTSELQNEETTNKAEPHGAADSKDEPSTSSMCDQGIQKNWKHKPCSGVNTQKFDLVDLSLEADYNCDDLYHLQTMFPSLDKEVLKSYLEIYQDIGECIRVVSTMWRFCDDNEVGIGTSEGTNNNENSLESPARNGEQAKICSDVKDPQKPKLPPDDMLNSLAKQENKGYNFSSEEKLKHDHGKSKSVVGSLEQRLSRYINPLESKAPLNCNSRDMATNDTSSNLLHPMSKSMRNIDNNKCLGVSKSSSNATYTNIGKTETKSPKLEVQCLKVHHRENKTPANQPLQATNTMQVGIDIRFGNNKVHPSMKRCVDRSIARRDIAKPYRDNVKDSKPATTPSDSRNKTSEVKSNNTSLIPHSSPSKRKYIGISSVEASTSKNACRPIPSVSHSSSVSLSRDHSSSRDSLSTSGESNVNTVINSSSFEKRRRQECSLTPGSSTNIIWNDFRSTPTSTSRNTSDDSLGIPSLSIQRHSPTSGSSNKISSNEFGNTSCTSRNTSDDSVNNTSFLEYTRDNTKTSCCLSSTNSFTKFISPVTNLNTLHVSYNASRKGKGPKLPISCSISPSVDTNQDQDHDWRDVAKDLNKKQTSTTNIQPQITTVKITGNDQLAYKSQEKTRNTNNQNRSTFINKEMPINIQKTEDGLTTRDTLNEYRNEPPIPEKSVGLVKQGRPVTTDLYDESQNKCHSLLHQEVSVEEKLSRQEMVNLQRDTEMLSKVCPECDPNYIFSRLESLKDNPNRVAIVNKEIVGNMSTSGVENVIQKQKKVVWYWEDKKMRQIPFNTIESNTIESKYNTRDSSIVSVQFSPLTLGLKFDFSSMTVQETLRGKYRHVHRNESLEEIKPRKEREEKAPIFLSPLSNPEIWHGHGNSSNPSSTMTAELLEVLPGISEFAHVDSLLKKSLPGAIIKKIERVKNDWLERKYGIQRGLLKEKNGPGGINEKELFHGTRRTPPLNIWSSEDGFDMRFSADGMWGRGCYFAVHAAYSHHQFTYQFIHKQKRYYQIFLAHVLTGDSITMDPNRSIIKPPLNASTGRQYDSITGITQDHQIYVLYKNEASFPAYLITYSM